MTLILDFDGTVTTEDIGDRVCGRFAAPQWLDIDRRWVRGELSLPEAQRQMWALCQCDRAAAVSYAQEVGQLRPGLDVLLDASRASGAALWLASGGFDFYIEPLLGPRRLLALSRRYYNRAHFESGEVRVEFPFLDSALSCERCAVCKGRVCQAARADGEAVVFIGDGYSDRCVFDHASPAVDRVFAVRGAALERLARERGLPVTPFADLAEVAQALFA